MEKKIRKVGDYEILNSIHIGDREVVLGENMNDVEGHYYMVCYATKNDFFEQYHEVLVSDNFLGIADIYSKRIQEQIDKTITMLKKEKAPTQMLTNEMCNRNVFDDNLEGKILLVNPSVLRPEYRTATHQIIKCTGGNGANPNAIGSAVFGKYCFNEKSVRFERADILGELKEEYYPEWLREKLNDEIYEQFDDEWEV